MKTVYAHTLTNPNDDNARFIKIELTHNKQIVKSAYTNPLTLDHREQRPNIKIGTEVIVLVDELSNYLIIGSSSFGAVLEPTKKYRVENEDNVSILTKDFKATTKDGGIMDKSTILTDKMIVKNSTAELITTLSDTLQALIDLEMIGNLGQISKIFSTSNADFTDLKAKIDSFKV